ncbi:MAG TPA: NADH-quinone oxidoreductase subunit C [Candidatus Binataceae bacterium]|nr:NADH-quinone oxidoreductase subunit C [Candidatus Binataceae bacterium]
MKERFGADILAAESAHGEESITIDRERAPEILRALRDEAGFEFNLLADLSAVDWLDRKPRFEVAYQLNSIPRGHRIRVKVGVDGADPWAHSAIGIWKAADWLERECFDMFGIVFKGHPDLRRILMYDSFKGHPLRKDYPYQKRQPVVPETDPVSQPLRPSR